MNASRSYANQMVLNREPKVILMLSKDGITVHKSTYCKIKLKAYNTTFVYCLELAPETGSITGIIVTFVRNKSNSIL